MALDLGRVQGASIFHTMAASGTSVAISSLQPQGFTPFVDDAVQFANGDVRQITAVSGSTVTLGDVLFSFKGDPGIGNATLSNIDGDSTENGFTQQYIKSGAQAKNYYNLGVYDTYVSNGDGTAMVTVRTGYLYAKNVSATTKLGEGDTVTYGYGIGYAPGIFVDNGTLLTCTVNVAGITPIGAWRQWDEKLLNCISIHSDGFVVLVTNGVEGETGSFVCQYLLPEEQQYSYKVIENQPIHIANQEESYYWHEEWRKGLNLMRTIRPSVAEPIGSCVVAGSAEVEPGKTYTISFTGTKTGDTAAAGHGGWLVYNTDTPLNISSQYPWGETYVSPDTILRTEAVNVDAKETYTLTKKYLYLLVGGDGFHKGETIKTDNLMLNEGDHPYPYKSYHGGIMRAVDVPIYYTTETTSPAETIGGDWESLGSFTTSDNKTIYAWRRL